MRQTNFKQRKQNWTVFQVIMLLLILVLSPAVEAQAKTKSGDSPHQSATAKRKSSKKDSSVPTSKSLSTDEYGTQIADESKDATIQNKATVGMLYATNDNEVPGFHRVITSPDGKYSVRVFVLHGECLARADIQIRSNVAPATIMWNGHVSYQAGTGGTASNKLYLPTAGTWYGNDVTSIDKAISVFENKNTAWGYPDVYYYAPEQRSYMWTSTDASETTVYTLSFMMGASTPFVATNELEVSKTKAYLQINQIGAAD